MVKFSYKPRKGNYDSVWFQEFLSIFYCYMVKSNYFYLIIDICLLAVIWYHISNNNNPKETIDYSEYK